MNRFSRRLLRYLPVVVVLLLAFLVFASRASAQNTAALEVVVTDPSDLTIADATVVLQGVTSPSEHRQGVSKSDGRVQIEVPPGSYRLTITHESLQRVEQGLSLAAGERRELRIALRLEPLSEKVVVSAEALPIAATAATVPINTITREDLEARQATQLAPLLATLPGITLGQTGPAGGVSSLFLDGGNSNYTKVLVDGISANEPGGGVDFSYFTLANIDKIEVVHGAESALTGSDAMTGTIQVLTHRGSTRTPVLVLESDGGSFSTAEGTAQLSGLAGPLDYSAATNYFTTQGQGPNDRFLNRTLSGNFGLRLAERDTIRVVVRGNTSDAGEPGQTLFVPPNLYQHNNLHNITAGLTWNVSTGMHWQHEITASETDIHQFYDSLSFPSRNQYNRADFQAQSSYVLRRAAVTAGYWYEVENGFVAFLGGEHVRRNNQAGFLDGRWQPVERLTFNAGFRVEDNTSFATRVVPRAGASYVLRYGQDFWGATKLRFSYGEGIKEPRLYESFGTDPCDPGNPNLRPEQSRTINAGVEQQLARDKIFVSGTYFDNRFTDMVSFNSSAPTANCPFGVGQYFNTDLARARGANLASQARITRHLTMQGNYTYDASLVIAAPNAFSSVETPGNHLLRRPVNSGSIVMNATVGRFNGTVAGVFVGRRTDSDFLFPPLALTSNPGYARFDIAGSFRATANISFIARVQNLLNKNYQDALGYPTLGRGAYAGMRFTFGGE